MRTSYSLLNPTACAVASGVCSLVLVVVAAFGMLSVGSMMGSRWMMGGYGPFGGYPGYHMTGGGALFILFWAAIAGTLVGLVSALVYNAVVGTSVSEPAAGASVESRRSRQD